jgi:hypothetical protein
MKQIMLIPKFVRKVVFKSSAVGSGLLIIAAEKPLSINEIEMAINIAKSPIKPYCSGERILARIIPTINVMPIEEIFSMNPHLAPDTAVCFRLSPI